MSWADGPLYPFDAETDGPDPTTARIITAAVLRVGLDLARADYQWTLKPERPIPPGATAIHHITTGQAEFVGVERRAAIGEIVVRLYEALRHGVPVVAFNATYDLTLIDREARRVGVTPLIERLGGTLAPILDPYVIDGAVDRYRPGKRNLGATCELYGVRLQRAHDATADALGAAHLMYMIAKRYPWIGDTDLGELHEMQIAWRASQCASMAAHKARHGRAEGIDPSWPMIPPGVRDDEH